tara:strand:- start:7263 stop:8420 length:1158 start_codon:yes stop_codon:yes gene_type:complete
MGKYKNIARKLLNENLLYQEGIEERIHPELEEQLRDGRHSLGECGIFPEEDIITNEVRLMRERFKDVVYKCREAFDMDIIDDEHIMSEQMPLLNSTMKMEGPNKKALQELAIKMVTEEFDIPEGSIDFTAELRPKINLKNSRKESPELVDEEFNDHDEIKMANSGVKKRRVLNAMGKGAASNLEHMFHNVRKDLSNMNPRLPQAYNKMMSAGDYMYFIKPDTDDNVQVGMCEAEVFGDEEGNGKPSVKAQGMTFPVLVHELCKGVMELLSMHGRPEDDRIAEYVSNNADFTKAEPWDMRLGPAIWERFCSMIPEDDKNMKHHVYTELASLPSNEFNETMREILAKTKKGKEMISEMLYEIKEEIKEDEFNETMGDSCFDAMDLLS